jgi:hypothetical protein
MWIVVAMLILSVVVGKWLRNARAKHDWSLVEG